LSDTAGDPIARPANAATLSALGLSALGVVFGDIGTSPLYTLKTVLGLTGGAPDAAVTLGVLSLVIWTLIVVTTIKYVSIAMRVDNDGEGGILALMSLLGVKRQHRPIIIAFGLFGAALIYGDGAITPAISVLSALEGLDMVIPAFAPYVLPASVVILVALFAIQPQGTGRLAGRSARSWHSGSRRSRCSGFGVSQGILRFFSRSTPGMGSAISSPAEVLDFSSSEGSSCA
jgi:KUP system potassium uptake protein